MTLYNNEPEIKKSIEDHQINNSNKSCLGSIKKRIYEISSVTSYYFKHYPIYFSTTFISILLISSFMTLISTGICIN